MSMAETLDSCNVDTKPIRKVQAIGSKKGCMKGKGGPENTKCKLQRGLIRGLHQTTLRSLQLRTPHMFQATEFFAAEDITRVSPNLENEDGEGELRIDAQHAVVVREIDAW